MRLRDWVLLLYVTLLCEVMDRKGWMVDIYFNKITFHYYTFLKNLSALYCMICGMLIILIIVMVMVIEVYYTGTVQVLEPVNYILLYLLLASALGLFWNRDWATIALLVVSYFLSRPRAEKRAISPR